MNSSSGARSPAFAKLIATGAFLLLYIPLATVVVGSFIPVGLIGQERRFTMEWYQRALVNQAVLESLLTSLWVALSSSVVATLIGTVTAVAIQRLRFPGRQALYGISHIPLIMPEVVQGLSLLVWFVFLNITLGSTSIIIAHITFSISYVILTVTARLHWFDESLEEAARDLGASPWKTFTRVTLPLVWPGILSGALMAFTLSFDDFLIAFFTAGVGSDTLPLRIYAMIKYGVTPEINALSTIIFGVTVAVVALLFGFRMDRVG